MHAVVYPWLDTLLCGGTVSNAKDAWASGGASRSTSRASRASRASATAKDKAAAEEWRIRLDFHLYEAFCEARISELFDIITDYPESKPSLIDLKACLRRTHQVRSSTGIGLGYLVRNVQSVVVQES